jgi:hypothetical protein
VLALSSAAAAVAAAVVAAAAADAATLSWLQTHSISLVLSPLPLPASFSLLNFKLNLDWVSSTHAITTEMDPKGNSVVCVRSPVGDAQSSKVARVLQEDLVLF